MMLKASMLKETQRTEINFPNKCRLPEKEKKNNNNNNGNN